MTRRDSLFLLAVGIGACATPRVDGHQIVPASPASYADTPVARTPVAKQATPIPDLQSLSLARVVDLALQNNPATRQSWASALAATDDYGASRG